MPKISVIVPVYNCKKYLAKCLDSLINQTLTDIEIICVDDGSTDNSYGILQKYAENDDRIKLYQQKNQGVAIARNTALQYATGEWLAFCDGDDTVPLNAYEKLYALTKNCDVVVGDFYDIDDYGVQDKALKKPAKQMSTFAMLFKVPCIWTKLIRRSFIEENNLFFEEVTLGEDVIFLAHVAALQPKCQWISDAVYYHWNHNKETEKSLNHQYDYAHFQMHIYCRDELLRICYQENGMQEAYYYIYHNMLGFLLNYLFRIQDYTEKEKAFHLFRAHLMNYNWENELKRFECIVGIPYTEFKNISAIQYFTTTKLLNHEEMVLKGYEAGLMGFRYILKYIKAWTEYKIHRLKVEHKK